MMQARVKAYFADGKICESDEMLSKYCYKNIKYDVNQLKNILNS
jgi:hypothetical protein